MQNGVALDMTDNHTHPHSPYLFEIGNLRFIGHLDLQSLWERAFRRADLPMQFSQGFSPKVRLNLASALPLGITSDCEVIDFWLVRATPLDEIHQALEGALPVELKDS